ncbi:ring-opening amidohydrolase [Hydrogenophaga palleronii]|uniref:cyanuric acid amidohydrolase n=1 Tax=Hydrogenophaga palleronii TaxID=65655 RepID=UPI00082548DA|nr:ring-opening amidohydrolase [Hydrogenophaga palleronii]
MNRSMSPRQLQVFRLSMAHPGDLSALAALLDDGRVRADDVVAVIGKTEGNGGVNDFTRGYFTQSLMHLLGERLGRAPAELQAELPCVLSGGTEGVLSPHYSVFVRTAAAHDAPAGPALAIGRAFSPPTPAAMIGRWAQVRAVADAVRHAMADAGIDDPADVCFVQVKGPCVTAARAAAALAAGQQVASADPNRSMALSRAAGAFGVALALGEMADDPALEAGLLTRFDLWCGRAGVSTGVEVQANEIVLLGHSAGWRGPLRMACEPMADALDLPAITRALARLGLRAEPQLGAPERARVAAALVKCEPDRRGDVRGARHTMLDDTDINAQRHIRAAVGGLVAGALGDGRVFVSGGAEHQGPDGGGLVAVIAEVA